jgi:hypothetical protein
MSKWSCLLPEFERHRREVGQIMGRMLLDIMNPLYDQHPEIKPTGLK